MKNLIKIYKSYQGFIILFFCLFSGGFFYSCEKTNDSVIDPTYYSPVISNPQRSTDTVRTTSSSPLINFSTSVSVNLNQGASISNVRAILYMPDGGFADSIYLSDNGSAPDITANDGVYSGTFNITGIQCLIVGGYRVDYIAKNSEGLFSNLIVSTVPVINTANQPPVIVSTDLPETVVRPPQGGNSFPLTISITADDADGLCDLRSANLRAYRPTGNLIGTFDMSYQGNGLYSFTSSVDPGTDTTVGYYKYFFTVTDNSNVTSIEVKDSINFVKP